MEALDKKHTELYVVEKLQLLRATINETQEFRETLESDMTIGYKNFIIDLSMCEYLDSTFVGTMVYIYKKLKKRDGNVLLVKSSAFSEIVFLVVEALTLFQIFHSVEEAVSYLYEAKFDSESVLNHIVNNIIDA